MRSALTKLLSLGLVLALLMAMLLHVRDLVEDRKSYRAEAEESVVRGTAGPQSLVGPILLQQCTESWQERDEDGKPRKLQQSLATTISPARLQLDDARVTVTPLKLGLYPVNTFTLKTRVKAHFNADTLSPQSSRPGATLRCMPPVLALAIGDPRGIRRSGVQINQQALPVQSGTTLARHPQGIHAKLDSLVQPGGKFAAMEVEVDLELLGTSSLSIVPAADDTSVKLSGNWPHPGFGGSFLPAQREINDQGFQAQWNVSSLATSAFSDFNAGAQVCAPSDDSAHSATMAAAARVDEASEVAHKACLDAFQVRFVNPVDPYKLADRAGKYGLLFVALTFVAVGMFEVLRQLRVHPVQYLLVGSALAIFFLLLLSLSEHYPFALAYLAAASACVLLLGFYASHILHGWKRGVPFGAGIALLYGLLFLLLQLEENALLVGSIALFLVLAVVMFATRRVNWYTLLDNTKPAYEGSGKVV